VADYPTKDFLIVGFDGELRARVEASAKQDRRSISQQIQALLDEALSRKEAQKNG
jgi:hypothetical protein